jgi:hypothetical protein
MKGPVDAVCSWLHLDDRDTSIRWRVWQATTRDRRFSRTGRLDPAVELHVTIRGWVHEDGDAPLVVLAAPPPEAKP